jgi:uncharacterized protein YecT (DUF1311 family)
MASEIYTLSKWTEMKVIVVLCAVFLVPSLLFSQGHIDHLKNQPYLKDKHHVNCSETSDTYSARICANLEFQRRDSVLTIYFKKLCTLRGPLKWENLQKQWRDFRDKHCDLANEPYEGGIGNEKYVVYLVCLTTLTNHRIDELKKALEN